MKPLQSKNDRHEVDCVDRDMRKSAKRLPGWAVSRKHFALSGTLADRVISLAQILAGPSAMRRVSESGESTTSSCAGTPAMSIRRSPGFLSRCAAPLRSYNKVTWH